MKTTDYKELYPTPDDVIEKMLSGVDYNCAKTVLEPSAGKGNLAHGVRIRARVQYQTIEIDCVEIDPDLRNLLKGAGERVIGDDFLSFKTMKQYDLILMNPPFSEGDKHLAKALQMQKNHGGAVIALVNAETIRNPYTNLRKEIVDVIDEAGGSVEYLRYAFAEAERQTDVEVALVKVQFPKPKRISSIMERIQKAKEMEEPEVNSKEFLADNDFIKSIVDQYEMEVAAGVKLIEEYKALQPYILNDFKKKEAEYDFDCLLRLKVGDQEASVNGFVKSVRAKYWRALFSNPKFTGKLTSNVLDEFQSKVSELRDIEFSVFNILEIKWDMMRSVAQGVEQSIVDLFDKFCKAWYCDGMGTSIHYYNGWKTNSAYKVNKKAILRLDAFRNIRKEFDPIWSNYSLDGGCLRKLYDMEKCFNFLDNGRTEDGAKMESILRSAKEHEQTKNIDLKYFTVTFYKKGTCHIIFKDDELLKKFNIFGAQHRGWLPPSYGKKTYEEMETEEQRVVDEFEGKEEYSKTMANSEFYLTDTNSFLLESK